MKFLGVCLGAILMFGQLSWAGPKDCAFTEASYKGQGSWADFAEHKGTYEVTTTISATEILSQYEMNGKAFSVKLAIDPATCEVTVVEPASDNVEKGHCMSTGCSYRIKTDKVLLEERFLLRDGKLLRVGFKVEKDKDYGENTISWAEALPPAK